MVETLSPWNTSQVIMTKKGHNIVNHHRTEMQDNYTVHDKCRHRLCPCMYLLPSRSPKQQSWLVLSRMARPTRTEALHGNRTCLLFQLHDILFRGSYPGLYSFHCYPFMTAPAWLATDVCNTNPVEINWFPTGPVSWVTLQSRKSKK